MRTPVAVIAVVVSMLTCIDARAADHHLALFSGWAPEVFLDLIETGENTWVGGLALGYGW